MQGSKLFIFVYGTLRRDCPSGAHSQYLHGAKFIASAKTRGHLFLIDYYPGLCTADKTQHPQLDSWVTGEVYLLKDEIQLQQLDRYEGCASDSAAPHEYIRKLIDVVLTTGGTMQLWTYIYNGDPSPFLPIVSGDFLRR